MIKNSVIVLLVTFFISSCSDAPTPIGVNLLGNDFISSKTINSVDDSIGQTSSYFHKISSLGGANTLLVGRTPDLEASTLVQFGAVLDDSIISAINNDSINIISAVMQFHRSYAFGDTLNTFDFSVHKINSEWTSGFSEDSLPGLQYDAGDVSTQKEITDSVTNVTISNDLALQWLQAAADTNLADQNKGIYIIPAPGLNQVIGYQALSSTYLDYPTMYLIIEKPGVYEDSISFYTDYNVSIVTGNIPSVSPGNILLRSGYLILSRLSFEIPKLPKDVIINDAELTLNVDTLETLVGDSYSNNVDVYFALDSTNLDSISAYTTLARNGNQFTGNITSFVREWVKGNNNGLILSTYSPSDGV